MYPPAYLIGVQFHHHKISMMRTCHTSGNEIYVFNCNHLAAMNVPTRLCPAPHIVYLNPGYPQIFGSPGWTPRPLSTQGEAGIHCTSKWSRNTHFHRRFLQQKWSTRSQSWLRNHFSIIQTNQNLRIPRLVPVVCVELCSSLWKTLAPPDSPTLPKEAA